MNLRWAFLLTILFSSLAACAADKQKYVLFVTGDHEYGSERTMPLLATELERRSALRTRVLYAVNDKGERDENYEKNIPGLEELAKADLVVFYLRWRLLPADQVQLIQQYLDSGKPMIGFRTTTHAFNYPKGHELEKWNAFGEFALGSPPGWGASGHTHYGARSSTDVFVAPKAQDHPILKGIPAEFHVRSWLYHVLPKYPPADATWLLVGRAVNPERKDAIENPVAWTWKTRQGARVFTTTLGHPEDFQVEAFQRLVFNAIHWGLSEPVPQTWPGKMSIDVSYEKAKK